MQIQLQRETAGRCRTDCCRRSLRREWRMALFHSLSVWKYANSCETSLRPHLRLQKQHVWTLALPLFALTRLSVLFMFTFKWLWYCLRWHWLVWLLCGVYFCVVLVYLLLFDLHGVRPAKQRQWPGDSLWKLRRRTVVLYWPEDGPFSAAFTLWWFLQSQQFLFVDNFLISPFVVWIS